MSDLQLICLGMNYRTAPVELRERAGLAARKVAAFSADFRTTPSPCHEVAILSTCNRVELYAAASDSKKGVAQLAAYWSNQTGVSADELLAHAYTFAENSVVEHLCRVAAGLDSIVVGEPQILGQVTHAYETATAQRTLSTLLRTLFRTAIRSGKRTHTETEIGRNAASVSSVAVKLAADKLNGLDERHVIMIGAGKMGKLALKAIRSHQIGALSLVNRTQHTAQLLADEFGGVAYGFEQLGKRLVSADLVLCSTAAPHTLIDRDMMQKVMARRTKPLVIIDIAVPRDVEPTVQQVDGVHLYDVDALQNFVDEALLERQKAIPFVEAIVAEEIDNFSQQRRKLTVRPTISDLHAKAETIRQKELHRVLKHLPDADETTRRQLEKFSQSLVKKMLHRPTVVLKSHAENGYADGYAETVRELFDL